MHSELLSSQVVLGSQVDPGDIFQQFWVAENSKPEETRAFREPWEVHCGMLGDL